MQEYKNQIAQLQETIAKTENSAIQLTGDIEAITTSHNQKLITLKSVLEKEKQDLLTQNNTLTETINNLNSELTTHNSNYKQKLDELQTLINKKEEANISETKLRNEEQSKYTKLIETLKLELDSNNEKHKHDIEQEKLKYVESEKNNTKIINELNQQIIDLQTHLQECKVLLQNSTTTNKNHDTTIKNLKEEIKIENQKFEKVIEETKLSLSIAKEELDHKIIDIIDIKQEFEQYKQLHQIREEDKDDARKTFDRLLQEEKNRFDNEKLALVTSKKKTQKKNCMNYMRKLLI